MIALTLAAIVGFLLFGPFGAIIAVLCVGFAGVNRRDPHAGTRHTVPGHSPLCGCSRCLKP